MKRIMFTFKDPLTNTPCVRWYLNLRSGRKFIRSLCSNVPYKITVNEDTEWRGTYFVDYDMFIEFNRCGRIQLKGDELDD